MMKLSGPMIAVAGFLLFSFQAMAEDASRHTATGYAGRVANSGGEGNQADVVVDMPPEVWTQGQNSSQPPCLRCCTYENRSYTEGAVVKMEGVLLQCRRDEKSFGTNNLIWQTVR